MAKIKLWMLQRQMGLLRNDEGFILTQVLDLGDFRCNWPHLSSMLYTNEA
jgi:hypothetical protein